MRKVKKGRGPGRRAGVCSVSEVKSAEKMELPSKEGMPSSSKHRTKAVSSLYI